MGKMYTVKEAAEELNVSEYTLRRYIKQNRIKATKYINTNKGSWYIYESEIKKVKGSL